VTTLAQRLRLLCCLGSISGLHELPILRPCQVVNEKFAKTRYSIACLAAASTFYAGQRVLCLECFSMSIFDCFIDFILVFQKPFQPMNVRVMSDGNCKLHPNQQSHKSPSQIVFRSMNRAEKLRRLQKQLCIQSRFHLNLVYACIFNFGGYLLFFIPALLVSQATCIPSLVNLQLQYQLISCGS